MRGRTTFVVAHRLSAVRTVTRLLVLDAGRVQEVGTHHERLELGGCYPRLQGHGQSR